MSKVTSARQMTRLKTVVCFTDTNLGCVLTLNAECGSVVFKPAGDVC